MRTRRLLVGTIVVVMAGCVSLTTYRDPESGPRSRVRFATESPGVSVLFKYADSECKSGEEEMLRLRAGPLFNSKPKRLAMPLWNFHENGAQEVYLSPGPFYARFEGGMDAGPASFTCTTPFAFEPVADHDYEVLFLVAPASCSVVLSEIVRTASGENARVRGQGIAVPPGACKQHKIRLM
jgi:hypothetical protein